MFFGSIRLLSVPAMAKNPADVFAKDWKAFQKVVQEVPEEFEKLIERRRDAFDRKTENSLHTVPMETVTPVEMRSSATCDFSRRPSADGCRVRIVEHKIEQL
ncbi:unnamed protein product [Durusdinium trenchii]|uniref:Uncharacterized protein n=2 Tax=Durusdinium trenchii TaxID=1381693 RepID=A0ABP0N851_9DINO